MDCELAATAPMPAPNKRDLRATGVVDVVGGTSVFLLLLVPLSVLPEEASALVEVAGYSAHSVKLFAPAVMGRIGRLSSIISRTKPSRRGMKSTADAVGAAAATAAAAVVVVTFVVGAGVGVGAGAEAGTEARVGSLGDIFPSLMSRLALMVEPWP